MRRKRSDAERAAWRAKMTELAKQIKAMTEDERAKIVDRCGTITAEGHPLSPFNCCYLYMQAGRELVQVGGFRQWQRAGRKVRPGEHACGYIWVPKKGAESQDGQGPEPGEASSRAMQFLTVPVFDIDQTEALDSAVRDTGPGLRTDRAYILGPADAARAVLPVVGEDMERREVFVACYLDTKNGLLGDPYVVSIGTLSSTRGRCSGPQSNALPRRSSSVTTTRPAFRSLRPRTLPSPTGSARPPTSSG